MRIYRVIIRADKYPTEYNVQASNWAPAVSRAIKEWQKNFKRKKSGGELNIKAIRSGELLKSNGEETNEIHN